MSRIRFRGRMWKLLALIALVFALAAAVFVLNASRAGRGVAGCPTGCSEKAVGVGKAIRIMTLNVLHGYSEYQDMPLRMSLIAEEIIRLQADIVALQEVPSTRRFAEGASFLAERTGMNYLYLRANGNRSLIGFEEGVAVLSRFELVDPFFVELMPRAGFFEHRVALGITARTEEGDLDIVVTHLTNGDANINQRQAMHLREVVGTRSRNPAVVAGDFNATESSPQIASLANQWTDVYRSIYPFEDGFTCCLSDLSAGPGQRLEKRIDYLFLAGDRKDELLIQNVQLAADNPAEIGGRWQWLSDHVGLIATIELVH